jgi:signal transduction histidine kinase
MVQVRWRRLRLPALMVLGVFVAGSLGIFVAGRHIVRDQEQRLLDERTGELGLLLASATAAIQSSLQSLGNVALVDPSPTVFTARARLVTDASPNVAAVALVTTGGGRSLVGAAAGPELPAGSILEGPRAALVARAGAKMRMGVFPVDGGESRFALVLGPPSAPPGTVIYQEYRVDTARQGPVTKAAPFDEMKVALYVGTEPDPATMLLATAPLPFDGPVSRSVAPVGGDSLLTEGSPRRPLVGDLTDRLPWLLAAGVLLVGLTMTALVETIGRRRDFAQAMVRDRTLELHASLDQLEAAQAQLVRSERLSALGEMSATVGHELRNPLGAVTNCLFLIRNALKADAGERLQRQLDTADREVAAATLIVSDLLEFARARAPMLAPVDVEDLVSEALEVAPLPRGIAVVRRGEHPPAVNADRDQLRQVLLNLLSNAYDAMPEGGTLEITTEAGEGSLEVTIADSGIGMDAETGERIFEPFFTHKAKGTGLGLSVTKRIIEDHAGTISVTSEPGAGTAFTLTLPVALVAMASR